ncbi:dienelactone hydrolase family protein [Leekyejoonella antrihumi]|uniref:Dienelactone hydrolase domain-containing protein n=1 Tax=Leekyejoonella antrihumi TaxID=1660198 RepID=A0A563DY09_9MICO|nr:hypothetical protein [Leekyejoonella antrihumi]TWP34554.1 hypothetical protein FGL98_16795 [Leekyejoonella antrihumi]
MPRATVPIRRRHRPGSATPWCDVGVDGLQVTGDAHDGIIREVSFGLHHNGREVPGVLWRPETDSVAPVVLLGHGGSGHKRSERNVRLATWFARAGIASLSIDGPFHGDRAVGGDGPLDYQDRIVQVGARIIHDRMRQDWLGALDAAEQSGWIDGRGVAFLGMSMGARYGLPVCAALGPRLRCAVIGKFGLTQTDLLPQGLTVSDLIIEAAAAIRAPVLQHIQWHDELFPRDGQRKLFDVIQSPGKLLRGRPGRHALTRPDDEFAWREHVATHLAP